MSVEPLLSNARVLMSALISISFSTLLPTILLNRLWVGFVQKQISREILCLHVQLILRLNGERMNEHIQGVGFIFPPTVAVKISQWHYFSSHPRMWKFQNNTLGIMQKTAYLIWKGQNRKSQKLKFIIKPAFQWGNFNFICREAILISFVILNNEKRHFVN